MLPYNGSIVKLPVCVVPPPICTATSSIPNFLSLFSNLSAKISAFVTYYLPTQSDPSEKEMKHLTQKCRQLKGLRLSNEGKSGRIKESINWLVKEVKEGKNQCHNREWFDIKNLRIEKIEEDLQTLDKKNRHGSN